MPSPLCSTTVAPAWSRPRSESPTSTSPASRASEAAVLDGSVSPEEAHRTAGQALWTFPSILVSAFVLAWGAEAAQFYISQGLALAILAWLQVMPEFAVEAVIAWHRDVALMTANFTGALRLLTGLGWPMIWMVYAFARRRRGERGFFAEITL